MTEERGSCKEQDCTTLVGFQRGHQELLLGSAPTLWLWWGAPPQLETHCLKTVFLCGEYPTYSDPISAPNPPTQDPISKLSDTLYRQRLLYYMQYIYKTTSAAILLNV